MEQVIELIRLVSGELSEAAQSEIVIGEPIELGSVRIVPLSRLSFGLGVGGGEGEGEMQADARGKRRSGRGKGIGSGAAIGAKVRPVAVAIFGADGVEVLPIADRKGILDRILDKIPKVIELVDKHVDKRDGRARRSGEEAPARADKPTPSGGA